MRGAGNTRSRGVASPSTITVGPKIVKSFLAPMNIYSGGVMEALTGSKSKCGKQKSICNIQQRRRLNADAGRGIPRLTVVGLDWIRVWEMRVEVQGVCKLVVTAFKKFNIVVDGCNGGRRRQEKSGGVRSTPHLTADTSSVCEARVQRREFSAFKVHRMCTRKWVLLWR